MYFHNYQLNPYIVGYKTAISAAHPFACIQFIIQRDTLNDIS